jgi:hypothetical protein
MTSEKVLAEKFRYESFLWNNLPSSIVGTIKASAFVFKYFECEAELGDVRGNAFMVVWRGVKNMEEQSWRDYFMREARKLKIISVNWREEEMEAYGVK